MRSRVQSLFELTNSKPTRRRGVDSAHAGRTRSAEWGQGRPTHSPHSDPHLWRVALAGSVPVHRPRRGRLDHPRHYRARRHFLCGPFLLSPKVSCVLFVKLRCCFAAGSLAFTPFEKNPVATAGCHLVVDPHLRAARGQHEGVSASPYNHRRRLNLRCKSNLRVATSCAHCLPNLRCQPLS